MVVITVIDKSGCDTFCTITGEPLVFGIEEINADVVVITVDVIEIAVGIAVNVSVDVVVDVVVGPVVDAEVGVVANVVVDLVVDVVEDVVVDVIVDVVVDVDDFVVESVVFSGSVLIGLMGIEVGEIGGGNNVVVLD